MTDALAFPNSIEQKIFFNKPFYLKVATTIAISTIAVAAIALLHLNAGTPGFYAASLVGVGSFGIFTWVVIKNYVNYRSFQPFQGTTLSFGISEFCSYLKDIEEDELKKESGPFYFLVNENQIDIKDAFKEELKKTSIGDVLKGKIIEAFKADREAFHSNLPSLVRDFRPIGYRGADSEIIQMILNALNTSLQSDFDNISLVNNLDKEVLNNLVHPSVIEKIDRIILKKFRLNLQDCQTPAVIDVITREKKGVHITHIRQVLIPNEVTSYFIKITTWVDLTQDSVTITLEKLSQDPGNHVNDPNQPSTSGICS